MQSSNENMFKKLSSDRNIGISASRRRHRGVSSCIDFALSCSSKILPNRQIGAALLTLWEYAQALGG